MRVIPRLLLASVALAAITACDQRANPLTGTIRLPAVSVTTGDYGLVAVNDTLLPHTTTNSGTKYSLVSATLSMHADSTWIYSTTETLTSTSGTFIGTSPANYQGSWTVTDSTIDLRVGYGSMKLKADTLFWRAAPRHTWEDSIKLTLVHK